MGLIRHKASGDSERKAQAGSLRLTKPVPLCRFATTTSPICRTSSLLHGPRETSLSIGMC